MTDEHIDLFKLAAKMGFEDSIVGALQLIVLFELCDQPQSPERDEQYRFYVNR